MIDQNTIPAQAVALGLPAPTKWDLEHEAFRRQLPLLLATHRDKYVAFHDQKLIGTGDDKLSLALDVLKKVGNVDIFVGLVSDQSPAIARSGVRGKWARAEGKRDSLQLPIANPATRAVCLCYAA
jgi:hypothetical protein